MGNWLKLTEVQVLSAQGSSEPNRHLFWPSGCWVAFGVCACMLSHVQLFGTAIDCSPPGFSLSLGFSRQDCWSRLPCSPPGELSNSRVEPMSPMAPAYYWVMWLTYPNSAQGYLHFLVPDFHGNKFWKWNVIIFVCHYWPLISTWCRPPSTEV